MGKILAPDGACLVAPSAVAVAGGASGESTMRARGFCSRLPGGGRYGYVPTRNAAYDVDHSGWSLPRVSKRLRPLPSTIGAPFHVVALCDRGCCS